MTNRIQFNSVVLALFLTLSVAFVPSLPGFSSRNRQSYVPAFADDNGGVPSGIKIDKSNKSNVSKSNLPPSSLPNGGRITLVGSGPGDPDLLTLAAYKIITDPDVLIISDRLVSKEILDLIQGEYKIARKLPGCAEAAQEEVCYIRQCHYEYLLLMK